MEDINYLGPLGVRDFWREGNAAIAMVGVFSGGFALVVYAVSAEERWSLCMVHVERGAWWVLF